MAPLDKNEKSELIDKFSDNSLSEEEKKLFEQSLEQDNDYAREAALNLAINTNYEQMRREEISDLVKARKMVLNKRKWLTISIAAIALVVTVLVLFFLFKPQNKPFTREEAKKSLMAVWERDQDNFTFLGDTNWEAAFHGKKYEEALVLLEDELEGLGQCEKEYLRYYAGVLYLYVEKDYQKAIAQLECTIELDGETSFRNDAPLHLMVAKLGAGDINGAKALSDKYSIDVDKLPLQSRDLIGF